MSRQDVPAVFPRRVFLMGLGTIAMATLAPRIVLADDERLKGFLGTFKYVGDDAERAARDKAIEDVVGAMNPIARSIARRKIQEATAIPAKLTIDADTKNLTITDQISYTGPIDGKTVKVKGYADTEMDLQYEVAKDHILMHLKGDGKGQKNRYALDKGKLKVHLVVFAKQLPKELAYELTFAGP